MEFVYASAPQYEGDLATIFVTTSPERQTINEPKCKCDIFSVPVQTSRFSLYNIKRFCARQYYANYIWMSSFCDVNFENTMLEAKQMLSSPALTSRPRQRMRSVSGVY